MATRRDADVIVIGAGIFGLSSAFACLERGLSVLVLERRTIGSGASGGIVGAMAPHAPDGWSAKKQFQFDALVSAESYWSRIDTISGVPCGYGRIGRIQPLANKEAHARALRRVEGAKRYWGERAVWRVETQAIHDNISARIHPANACRSLTKAIRSYGGIILESVAVSGIKDGTVMTANGAMTAKSIILAAGFESFDFLTPFLGEGSGSGVKGQAMLVRPTVPINGPMIHADGLYIVPHADGTSGIGSTSEDHWTDLGTDALLDALHDKAITRSPAIANAEVLSRWGGIRPKARGRDAMIGRISSTNSLFVATGGFKTAFGIAHEVGRVIAQMIVGEPVNLPPSFNPEYHRVKK